MEAEGKIMAAELDMNIIAECVVVSLEGGLWIGRNGEKVSHRNLVKLLKGRLPDVDTKVRNVYRSGQRSADGGFELITDVQVIQDMAIEGVGLGDQRVVVVKIREIGVGQQVLKI